MPGRRSDDPKASAPARAPEYVLGANEKELARLTLQQEVWGHVTEAFLDRAKIARGSRCLDLGCGPGLLIESLRSRVGPEGHVDALDESPVWHEHLARLARERGWKNVRLLQSKLQEANLAKGSYDLILVRWVLSFLPGIPGLVKGLAALLAPGGVLAVEDYNHEGISVFPESEGFKAVIRATRALWASKGGDMWIAGKLPAAFRAAGLEIVDYTPTVLAGGPTSGVFRWADAFFPLHSANMVRLGLLSQAERDLYLREWGERIANPDTMFFSPILVDVAGKKAR